jgi:hypothetical protein
MRGLTPVRLKYPRKSASSAGSVFKVLTVLRKSGFQHLRCESKLLALGSPAFSEVRGKSLRFMSWTEANRSGELLATT